jgi:hypothetical protein
MPPNAAPPPKREPERVPGAPSARSHCLDLRPEAGRRDLLAELIALDVLVELEQGLGSRGSIGVEFS